MYERSTNHRENKRGEKASDTEGMGAKRQWDRGCEEIPDSSTYSVSMEEGIRTRGRDLLSGNKPRVDARIKELEEENRKLKEALAA